MVSANRGNLSHNQYVFLFFPFFESTQVLRRVGVPGFVLVGQVPWVTYAYHDNGHPKRPVSDTLRVGIRMKRKAKNDLIISV